MHPIQPNTISVFTDDWGYGDLGSYGNRDITIPSLGKITSEETRRTPFHITNLACSPSRCSALTGRYPARFVTHGHLARFDRNHDRQMPNRFAPTALATQHPDTLPTLKRCLTRWNQSLSISPVDQEEAA